MCNYDNIQAFSIHRILNMQIAHSTLIYNLLKITTDF